MKGNKSTSWILGLAGGALGLITVILLISLRSSSPEAPPSKMGRTTAAPNERDRRPVMDSTPDSGAPTAASPAAPVPPQPPPPPLAPADAAPTKQDVGGLQIRPALAPTPGTHTAPPVVPTEILEEKDPARRARLERMHALAVTRVRASQLRRRVRLLEGSLSRAEQDNSWSTEKLTRARKDLGELKQAVTTAEKNVKKAQERVDREGDR